VPLRPSSWFGQLGQKRPQVACFSFLFREQPIFCPVKRSHTQFAEICSHLICVTRVSVPRRPVRCPGPLGFAFSCYRPRFVFWFLVPRPVSFFTNFLHPFHFSRRLARAALGLLPPVSGLGFIPHIQELTPAFMFLSK
jgi:hypothetical protein